MCIVPTHPPSTHPPTPPPQHTPGPLGPTTTLLPRLRPQALLAADAFCCKHGDAGTSHITRQLDSMQARLQNHSQLPSSKQLLCSSACRLFSWLVMRDASALQGLQQNASTTRTPCGRRGEGTAARGACLLADCKPVCC